MGRTVKVKIEGDFACFSEVKSNRKSYPIITPSAARNIIQAIVWKPEVQWHVRRLTVLKPVRFMSINRNEVKMGVSLSNPKPINVEDHHTQVISTVLRDVAYVVEVEPMLTKKGVAAGFPPEKFAAMLERRLSKGQHFSVPYLGLREFSAMVSLASGDEQPIQETRDLGMMTFDRFYPEDADGRGDPSDPAWSKSKVFFYDAKMVDGVIDVPDRREVMGAYA